MPEKMNKQQVESLGFDLEDSSRPTTFPGLCPISGKLKDLESQICELEKSAWELNTIRATILRNCAGMNEEHNTLQMVLTVLREFNFAANVVSARKEEKK